jgi:hypothetical protein
MLRRAPLMLALAWLAAQGCRAAAQPAGTDAGASNILQNTLGLYGVQMPPPDAGITPSSCVGYGASCETPKTCCSQQCIDGRCGDGTIACKPPGSPCSGPSQCCSAFCETGVCQ